VWKTAVDRDNLFMTEFDGALGAALQLAALLETTAQIYERAAAVAFRSPESMQPQGNREDPGRVFIITMRDPGRVFSCLRCPRASPMHG
jgi:hypothetical protein